MIDVEIYSTPTCSSCLRAKHLLARFGVTPRDIDVSEGRSEMTRRTGSATVPQIVIDGHVVGGYEDLLALANSGQLQSLLSPA